MTVKNGAKMFGKKTVALVLSASILVCGVSALPAMAKEKEKDLTRLYDYNDLAKRYLSENEEAESEYPNGAFMFPISSAQLKQDDLYAFEVFREGGTKIDGNADIIKTGGATMTVIILVLIASAAVIIFMRKRKKEF